MKAKIVCLVGHEDWGKSETLYYLVGSRYKRWIEVDGVEVFVRHMSNDDITPSFVNLIKDLQPDRERCAILALCPDFKRKGKKTEWILNTLRDKGYQLYFWVLYRKYRSSEVVTAEEIGKLEIYGEVEVYKEESEAQVRAKALETYLSKILK